MEDIKKIAMETLESSVKSLLGMIKASHFEKWCGEKQQLSDMCEACMEINNEKPEEFLCNALVADVELVNCVVHAQESDAIDLAECLAKVDAVAKSNHEEDCGPILRVMANHQAGKGLTNYAES
eukprot:9871954-Karenia_brevis.AAC.1